LSFNLANGFLLLVPGGNESIVDQSVTMSAKRKRRPACDWTLVPNKKAYKLNNLPFVIRAGTAFIRTAELSFIASRTEDVTRRGGQNGFAYAS
jgi:hypothetical protein